MAALNSFHWASFCDTAASLILALILGTLIGAERQYRQRNAGLRTNALVALGASAFVDLGMTLNGVVGATQVLAYVASGVGFLGAGVIVKDGTNIRGLNTAATLWSSAAVGGFAGADRAAEAILLTALVLAGNTFLRPLVRWIDRAPMNERTTEATYDVHLVCDDDHRDILREKLVETLEAANYPVRDVEIHIRSDSEIEMIATLSSSSIEPKELDAATAALEKMEGVAHATWTSSVID